MKDKEEEKGKNKKYYYVIATLLVSLGLVFAIALIPWSTLFPPASTPTSDLSTVKFFSNPDREDVSKYVPGALYLNTKDAEFEDWEDITNIAGNFQLDTTKLAEDLSFDMAGYKYGWIKIDPADVTVFATDWKLLIGGVNMDYEWWVYDTPAEVFMSLINDTLGAYNYGVDGSINGTILMDVNHTLTDPIHIGTGWEMTALKYADLTATRAAKYIDERYWTSLGAVYSPDDDTMTQDPRDIFEFYTTCWAIEITFNETVADATNDVVVLKDVNTPAEVVVVADIVYVIFSGTITFVDGMYNFPIQVDLTGATGTTIDSIDIGTIVVPKGIATTVGAFTAYP